MSRQTKSTCVAGLTVEELRLISKAVYGSEPDQWKIEDPNFAAQDAFQYRLELRLEDKRSGKTYKVEWYDNTEEHMPEKLKVLYQEIEKVWERIVNSC